MPGAGRPPTPPARPPRSAPAASAPQPGTRAPPGPLPFCPSAVQQAPHACSLEISGHVPLTLRHVSKYTSTTGGTTYILNTPAKMMPLFLSSLAQFERKCRRRAGAAHSRAFRWPCSLPAAWRCQRTFQVRCVRIVGQHLGGPSLPHSLSFSLPLAL